MVRRHGKSSTYRVDAGRCTLCRAVRRAESRKRAGIVVDTRPAGELRPGDVIVRDDMTPAGGRTAPVETIGVTDGGVVHIRCGTAHLRALADTPIAVLNT